MMDSATTRDILRRLDALEREAVRLRKGRVSGVGQFDVDLGNSGVAYRGVAAVRGTNPRADAGPAAALVRGHDVLLLGNLETRPWRPTWLELAFAQFWTHYPNLVYRTGVTRSPDGFVTLRGLVQKPGVAWTVNDQIITLPAGYRPGTRRIFPAVMSAGNRYGIARLTVWPDGQVHFDGQYAGTASTWDPNNWVSLDAIGYWAEQ